MVNYELSENAGLTSEERKILTRAKSLPVIYDEDSPRLSEDMVKAFAAARKKKPYRGERLAN